MTFSRFYASPRLPLWWRVILFAIDHDGMPLARGHLRDAVDPERLTRPAEISRAIRKGEKAGMLAPGSCAGVLLVPVGDEEAA